MEPERASFVLLLQKWEERSKGLCVRTECPFKLTYCCISCAERCGISSSHLRGTQLHPGGKAEFSFAKLLFLKLHFAPFFHFTL